MKVLADIRPELNENNEVTNAAFAGGAIVALTKRELTTLAALQEAWDGEIFRFPPGIKNTDGREMDDIFKAIRSFVEIKFAVNDFRQSIDNLDSMLMENRFAVNDFKQSIDNLDSILGVHET